MNWQHVVLILAAGVVARWITLYLRSRTGSRCTPSLHERRIVADWLELQSVASPKGASESDPSPSPEHNQRKYDLRLLRGES